MFFARRPELITGEYNDTRFSDYHASAAAYVSFLIDGQKLAQYMIENELGVSLKQSYRIYGIDTDYFVEE